MKKIALAICADENYAFNGAMALFSASKNIAKDFVIDAFVLDCGISAFSRRRFERVLLGSNLRLIWLRPDFDTIDHLPLSPWTTKAANARLMLPELLKGRTEKVIYLDSDMLVLGNIAEMWEFLMDGMCALACADEKYRFVKDCRASTVLVELGLQLSDVYFNSGLLVINIPRWMGMDISGKTIKILEEKGASFTHKDQDGLNFVLRNEWGQLDSRWNVCTPRFFSKDQVDQTIAEEAKIIHFTGRPPGRLGCRHPKRELFYQYVKDSNWFSSIEFFLWRIHLEIRDSVYFSMKRIRSLVRDKK